MENKVSIAEYCCKKTQQKDEPEETLNLIDLKLDHPITLERINSCPARLEVLDITLHDGIPTDYRLDKNVIGSNVETLQYVESEDRFVPIKKSLSCILS